MSDAGLAVNPGYWAYQMPGGYESQVLGILSMLSAGADILIYYIGQVLGKRPKLGAKKAVDARYKNG